MTFHIKMKSILKTDKKGQISIGDAPGIMLIVLFLFMIMGTSAFILDKYAEGFGAEETSSRINETVPSVDEVGETVKGGSSCKPENFRNVIVTNDSIGTIIEPANYSFNSATGFINVTSAAAGDALINGSDWNVSYTFDFTGTACNITEELAGEVEDNVSIAGMVLTISLIGIVLSILIGLFFVFTGKKRGL